MKGDEGMQIVGQQKTSFIDYPDKICTVYFAPGCNFRCSYCHNAPLVKGEGSVISPEEIALFLEERKKYIDGVCISGGEPTLQRNLPQWVESIKEKGFLVKLDTNGSNPKMLRELIDKNLLDYIAMDIKAPWHKYEKVAGVPVNIKGIRKSVEIIRNREDFDYEFRTTVCKELLSIKDILEMGKSLQGSKRYILQNFRDTKTVLGGHGQFTPYKKETLEEVRQELKGYFEFFNMR